MPDVPTDARTVATHAVRTARPRLVRVPRTYVKLPARGKAALRLWYVARRRPAAGGISSVMFCVFPAFLSLFVPCLLCDAVESSSSKHLQAGHMPAAPLRAVFFHRTHTVLSLT